MVDKVVISPATTIRPVVSIVSQATREKGSPPSAASTTASETWSAILSGWPSVTDSEVKRNPLSMVISCAWGVGFCTVKLGPDNCRASYHSVQLAPGDLGCEMPQSAVGVDHEAAGLQVFKGPADARGDEVGGLHCGRFHVDDAEAERGRPGVLLDELEVFKALAGELEDQLV